VNGDALLWLSIVSVLASCLAATAARALRDFSRHDLQAICERRQKLDRFGDIVRTHEQVALSVEMLVVLAVTLSATAGGLWAWHRFALDQLAWADVVWPKLLGIVAVVALVLAAMVVCLPWSIARVGAERFLYHTWPCWRLASSLVYPLAWCARGVDTLLHRLAGRQPQTPGEDSFEEEIRTIVTEGHREGLLEEDAREMIEGVIELGDVDVSHVMTPRTEMHMVNIHWPWERVLEYVISVGHTRIPVYDKTRDDIVGMLYGKDLLPELAKDPDEPRQPLVELLRKPLFVPEAKAVDDLLALFQQTRTHVAIVLDEYGGVSGLVTIEDVLEEIVGEIEDEYDPEAVEEIRRIDEDVCEALGRAHVEEINEVMGFDLPEDEDFDTIGGFVFTEFGRVPLAGESMTWLDQVEVTVLEATRRRVSRVRLERIRKESREMA
jgi:CBS domain containing-hemolysin-like protein